jgi:hypothetical protein
LVILENIFVMHGHLNVKNIALNCYGNTFILKILVIHYIKPTKCTNLFTRNLHHNITLNILPNFDP